MPFANGTRVRINSGMKEFIGATGTVTNREKDGQTVLHRVELDTPVMIPGVGVVTDDLWSKDHLTELDE